MVLRRVWAPPSLTGVSAFGSDPFSAEIDVVQSRFGERERFLDSFLLFKSWKSVTEPLGLS